MTQVYILIVNICKSDRSDAKSYRIPDTKYVAHILDWLGEET